MSYWQGDHVNSGCWCLIGRVTVSAVGVDVLLTGWPCQQWVLMSYWQGDPVSSGCWCLIGRVTMSAVGVDVLLAGWPCQQWVLMSYWQGDPVSSGYWCLIGRVLRDREVACSASDRQGPNFESCVWRTVSSQSSHHPQEVLLAQFSLYVHKGGLKPDSFHFLLAEWPCQQWVLMSYWQGDPVSSGCWCLIGRVTLSAVVLMCYWQGDPVSSGCWCLIGRVTLSAVGVDVLLAGWPCQQ